MGKALYRKYRSKNLSEIVGQEHITDTLKRALEQDQLSHAYLFTGPRGVGKTSIARILAFEANNLPYDEDKPHLDIIEIDAASNRRIDEIRGLKEKVNIAPTSAKYKVYIIDEVHMLTKEAFNALLKTLEEPPSHVIFILATTEAHKVPETIISRTQRYSFKPVESIKVQKHLQFIAKKENIKISDDALMLISKHGEGSFRDSISLLDQVRHISSDISLKDVRLAVGEAPDELLDDLIDVLITGDIKSISEIITKLRDFGIQSPQVAKQLSRNLRDNLVNEASKLPRETVLGLLQALIGISSSNDPDLGLELALYETALLNSKNKSPNVVQGVAPTVKAERPPVLAVKPNISKPQQISKPEDLGLDTWEHILSVIKTKHNTLYGITRMAVPSFQDNKLVLNFAFEFHQKRLVDSKNRHALLAVIKEVTGKDIELDCILDQSSSSQQVIPKPEIKKYETSNLETISNIFGGAEIVE